VTKTALVTNVAANPGRSLLVYEVPDDDDETVLSEGVTLTDSSGNEVVPATQATAAQIAANTAIGGELQLGETQTVTNAAQVKLLAANPSRRGFLIQNNGVGVVRVGPSGVDATHGIRVTPNGTLGGAPSFLPLGDLYAIAEGADCDVYATEIVAS
jgi:hypothetical protein